MLRTFGLALLAALPISAYSIPSDLTDGVYAAFTDASGAEVHHLIWPASTVTPSRTIDEREPQASSTLTPGGTTIGGAGSSPPPSTGYKPYITFCNCTVHLSQPNTDVAVTNLENSLGTNTFIPANVGYFSIANNVVAYACNQNSVAFLADSDYFSFATAEITQSCGKYVEGTFLLSGLDAGYMAYANGTNFCEESEEFPEESC
jgi:hypothetical protein